MTFNPYIRRGGEPNNLEVGRSDAPPLLRSAMTRLAEYKGWLAVVIVLALSCSVHPSPPIPPPPPPPTCTTHILVGAVSLDSVGAPVIVYTDSLSEPVCSCSDHKTLQVCD